MIADRIGDGVALSLGAGEIGTERALQFRELADALGDEIGLGEPRGSADRLEIGPDDPLADQPFGELRHPLGLVGDGAELLVEDDAAELLRLLGERHLQILLPEEFRVREARGEHLAIALDDRGAAVRRLDIGDADEVRGKRAVLSREREIFLVGAHGELDHLARHVEEGRIEAPEQRHRPFGEPGILGDQPLVLDQAEPGVGGRPGGAVGDDPPRSAGRG
jgi:hypothetical protein